MGTIPEEIERLSLESPDSPSLVVVKRDAPDEVFSRGRMWNLIKSHRQRFMGKDRPHGSILPIVADHDPGMWAAFFGAMAADLTPSIMAAPSFKTHMETYTRNILALLANYRTDCVAGTTESLSRVRAALGMDALHCRLIDLATAENAPDAAGPKGGLAKLTSVTAFLQHSSGSTGIQKGVALSHEAVVEHVRGYGRAIGLAAGDVIVSWLPLYHDMGLIACCLQPMLLGIPVVWISPLEWVMDPMILWEKVSQYRGTHVWLPNFAYNFLVDRISEEDMGGLSLASLKMLVNCSEPVQASSHRGFAARYEKHGLNVKSLKCSYAMAENVFAVSQVRPGCSAACWVVDSRTLGLGNSVRRVTPDADYSTELLSSGRVLEDTEVKILDEALRPLPPDTIGQIAIKGRSLFQGYHMNEEKTRAAMDPHGFFLTGDVGFLGDGDLFVTGRLKDLIIACGRNFYPNDLEAIANSTEGVKPGRTVAFGLLNPVRGTEDVYLLLESGDAADPQRSRQISSAVRSSIAQRLDCSVDRVVVLPLNTLIKTTSGKIARTDNKKWFVDHHLAKEDSHARASGRQFTL